MSDIDGVAQVGKIPGGTYRVSVSGTGYAPRALGPQSYDDHTVKQLRVELAKVASLSGQLTDTDGLPLKGVKVRPYNSLAINGRGYSPLETREATTDDAGRFELAGLRTGFVQPLVNSPEYHYGDTFAVYDVPTTNLLLRPPRAGRIRVTVTDKTGKARSKIDGSNLLVNVEPIEGREIGFWSGRATANVNGSYEFNGLSPDEYRVSCQPASFTLGQHFPHEQLIRLDPGADVTVRIEYE